MSVMWLPDITGAVWQGGPFEEVSFGGLIFCTCHPPHTAIEGSYAYSKLNYAYSKLIQQDSYIHIHVLWGFKCGHIGNAT